MDIRLNRKQKERLFRLLERGCNSLAYWWDCEMDGEHKDAVNELVRLQDFNDDLRAENERLRAKNADLRTEILRLKKQIDPDYSPIKRINSQK